MAQLRLLFDVQPPYSPLLFMVQSKTKRLVCVDALNVLESAKPYFAFDGDDEWLPTDPVFVQSNQPGGGAAGGVQAESVYTKPATTIEPQPAKSTSSGKQRQYKDWVALSDKTWPLTVPR